VWYNSTGETDSMLGGEMDRNGSVRVLVWVTDHLLILAGAAFIP